MRVLMVDLPAKGGMVLYTGDLCRSLAAQGAEVTLLTSTEYERKPADATFDVLPRLRPMHGNKRFVTRLHWMADRFGIALWNGVVRNNIVRNGSWDVVHLQQIVAPVDQFILRPITGQMPLVLTVHDTIPHAERFVSRPSALRCAYRHFDRLIVHYERGRANLVERYGVPADRIEVIPHGLRMVGAVESQEDARRKLGLPPGRRILLFFGTVRPDKGLGTLLKAMARARQQIENVLLVIAGSAPKDTGFGEYEKLITALGLDPQVKRFIRFIEDEEIPRFFAAADVCTLPYDHFDSQSGVLMQAYAHYRPVLVTDVGAVGDMVRADGVGVVVTPADPDALAEGLREVTQNHEKYRDKCGPKTTMKYTWSRSAQMSIDCYRTLSESRRRAARRT